MHTNSPQLQSFDCQAAAPAPSAQAAAPRSERPRSFDLTAPYHAPSLQFFDCEAADLVEGAMATPRPSGKERRVPAGENAVTPTQVEQKVVSIMLELQPASGVNAPPKAEYFREYLAEGWKVKQLTSIGGSGAAGWIVVLLEREPSRARELTVFS